VQYGEGVAVHLSWAAIILDAAALASVIHNIKKITGLSENDALQGIDWININ